MEDNKTGWERENRTHFDKIVVSYDKARLDYPDELFEDIMKYSRSVNKKALEIGAGTGKATTPFLNAGYDVTAVEMGRNMAEFMLERFKGIKNINVVVSTFEEVALEEDSYDLVYAASAFHWVDAEIGCPKVFRLLKNGGSFALLRYNSNPVYGDELYGEIQTVYDKYYYSYYKQSKRPVRAPQMSCEDFLKPSEVYRGYRFKSLEQYGFKDVTMKLYNVSHSYEAEDYMALIDTFSDHRALPDDNRVALYSGIKESILKHGGQQKMNIIFQLYMGRKQ
ncbi:MAG: class I SAM-dependent methyltransferase [Bacteroidales bacterium]|nr:class I SAM-dependent methyltransferase [Bacteroidales bacterium]